MRGTKAAAVIAASAAAIAGFGISACGGSSPATHHSAAHGQNCWMQSADGAVDIHYQQPSLTLPCSGLVLPPSEGGQYSVVSAPSDNGDKLYSSPCVVKFPGIRWSIYAVSGNGMNEADTACGAISSEPGASSPPSSSPSSPSTPANTQAAYAGGYSFGNAAATTNGTERGFFDRYSTDNGTQAEIRAGCSGVQESGVPANVLPGEEAPPASGPAATQWVNGCVAGFNAGSG
jgi:hypothetical protein